jgi:hypothetical protein
MNITVLLGKTLTECKQVDDDEIVFTCSDGETYRLYHSQECCENVNIESITGDLADLVGHPILVAEESTSDKHPADSNKSDNDESFTWTFYKLATIRGHVDIRWYGESNGYYSESVDFEKVEDEKEAA